MQGILQTAARLRITAPKMASDDEYARGLFGR